MGSIQACSAASRALTSRPRPDNVCRDHFWNNEIDTEWNEPEAMKMLSQSPWSRTLLVLGGTLSAAELPIE